MFCCCCNYVWCSQVLLLVLPKKIQEARADSILGKQCQTKIFEQKQEYEEREKLKKEYERLDNLRLTYLFKKEDNAGSEEVGKVCVTPPVLFTKKKNPNSEKQRTPKKQTPNQKNLIIFFSIFGIN